MSDGKMRTMLAIPAAALLAGLLGATALGPRPTPAPEQEGAVSWQLPALPAQPEASRLVAAIARRQVWGESSEAQGERDSADAARRAAEQAQAARDAHTWRFVGSIEQGDALRAVFRAGDGRTRHLVAGEEIEHGARLVELQANSAVIELPMSLRAQNELPETEGPVRLQLFHDTEFSLYIEEE
jgi:hypothetical protein